MRVVLTSGITLSSVFGKRFDEIILSRLAYADKLIISQHQFSFKGEGKRIFTFVDSTV